jgi:hypothetical protein
LAVLFKTFTSVIGLAVTNDWSKGLKQDSQTNDWSKGLKQDS